MAVDAASLVDPELRPILDVLAAVVPMSDVVDDATIAAMRDGGGRRQKPFLAEPAVEQVSVPGRGGQPDVPVYVINARAGERRPAILHMHGGGYIAGVAAMNVADMQVLARVLDCVVVTVDYRLAPETPFPGALEDNYAALAWLHGQADALGVDPARVAIMGESAGGGHAAMLAIAARDRGEFPICLQVLVYPMIDDRTGSTVEPPAHEGALLWTRAWNRAGWRALLGREPGGDDVPPQAAPARLADLSGLPPAFIGTGALDLFAGEDVDYARRLNAAGVPTDLLVVPGAFHGFDVMAPMVAVSRRFRLAIVNALARAFGRPELAEAPPPAPAADPAA